MTFAPLGWNRYHRRRTATEVSERATPRHHLLGTAILTGMSCLLAVGASEVLVRVFAPQQLILKLPDVWQGVDTLGWPHRDEVAAVINTGERSVRFITDRFGFRVGSRARAAWTKRVLLLGDSFMEAMQVEYEQSTAGLLEAGLERRLGAPVA